MDSQQQNEIALQVIDSGNNEIHSDIKGSPEYHSKLYKAAIGGDWETAESIFNVYPGALTAPIGPNSEIALHSAVKTGRSVAQFVQNLVDMMPPNSLEITDELGETALHRAAYAGNTKAAKIMVKKYSKLPQIIASYGFAALHTAAFYGHKETVSYLLSVTQDVEPSPFAGETGVLLLHLLIIADFYDMALYLLKRFPELKSPLKRDLLGRTSLEILATKPYAFESGSRLGRGQPLIYHCWSCFLKIMNLDPYINYAASHQSPEEYLKTSKRCRFIQHIQNTMLMHKQAMELLRILINEKDSADLIAALLFEAAELGIAEFVAEATKAYPHLIGLTNADNDDVFHVAVLHRQEKIYNLLHQMSSQKVNVVTRTDKNRNNLLHKAGKLGSSDRISGAALQMQRELQWFKEVEMIIQPSDREQKNGDRKTPRMLFTESHKDLVKEGEKWMKDTASSFTLVAALVVTVVFATAFTVPGGNNSGGIPIYVNQTSFLIFAASNILALSSSITSLLMFLSILTSRYAEEDFLLALPMRLCIGLITLFFSMAAMLVAFSASFYIVLAPRVAWIAVPISVLASVPVILFVFLQFPLLVQIVAATFGPRIFGKQSDEIIC